MKKYRVLFMMALTTLLLCVMAGQRTEAMEKTAQQINIVELPQNLNFYLDPENEGGLGQIYSDKYRIRNEGKEPIAFSAELVLSILEEQADIAFCPEEWSTEPENRSIYMYVVFEGTWGEDICVLTDYQMPCSKKITLKPAGMEGDTVYISFGGELSQSEEWKSGELGINCLYSISMDSMKYQAVINGNHIRLKDEEGKLEAGKKAELYLVPDEGYSLPAKIQVYMDEMEIEASYDATTGQIVLDKVSGDVVIYANGIKRAALPGADVIDSRKSVWSWTAEDGVQTYEYKFLQDDEVVDSGRLDVNQGVVNWSWSEKLEDGSYELRLKAIGDTVHCLNSEEGSYPVTVEKALLEEEDSQDGNTEEEDSQNDNTEEAIQDSNTEEEELQDSSAEEEELQDSSAEEEVRDLEEEALTPSM